MEGSCGMNTGTGLGSRRATLRAKAAGRTPPHTPVPQLCSPFFFSFAVNTCSFFVGLATGKVP